MTFTTQQKRLWGGTFSAINRRVQTLTRFLIVILTLSAVYVTESRAASADTSNGRFYYRDFSGRTTSVRVVRHYWAHPIVHPLAHVDPRINPNLMRAATIAQERSNARSKGRCWHYVKEALLASGAVSSYPKTAFAAEAGNELVHSYGFTKLAIHDPYSAPVGSVLVYGNVPHGHVEIRTKDGFVSDYHSRNACYYPLVAVYAKL